MRQKTTTSLEDRFTNFFLLNGIFTTTPGLMKGKSALALYFYYAAGNRYDIGFTQLEDLIECINGSTPGNFGQGTAGFGVVLEHLVQEGLLEQDTHELLQEMEQVLFTKIHNGLPPDISLETGASGIGLYLLYRMNAAAHPSNPLFLQMQLKQCLDSCIFRIERTIQYWKADPTTMPQSYSIWAGIPGILLFLDRLKYEGNNEPTATALLEDLITMIITAPSFSNFSWDKADAWFVLLHLSVIKSSKQRFRLQLNAFQRFLQQAGTALDSLDPYTAAFTAMFLKMSYQEHGIIPALHLSDRIVQKLNVILTEKTIPGMFPHLLKEEGIRMGLLSGACGTALPLWSLEHRDFRWTKIFGVNTQEIQTHKNTETVIRHPQQIPT